MRKTNRGRKAFVRDFTAMRDEGQGIWQLSIYNPEGAAEAMIAAALGDRYAQTVVDILLRVTNAVLHAKPPMLCLTCDNELSEMCQPLAFVLMHARRDDPTGAMANGICPECRARYPDMDALGAAAADVYRQKMMPDLRILPPISDPGHA